MSVMTPIIPRATFRHISRQKPMGRQLEVSAKFVGLMKQS